MAAPKGLLPLHGRAARAAAHGGAALTTALPQAGSGRALFPTFQQRARLVDECGAATALEPRPNQHAHLLGVAVGGETIIGCSAAGGQRARQGACTPQGATCSTAWHLLPDTRAQPAVGRAVPAEGSLEWRRAVCAQDGGIRRPSDQPRRRVPGEAAVLVTKMKGSRHPVSWRCEGGRCRNGTGTLRQRTSSSSSAGTGAGRTHVRWGTRSGDSRRGAHACCSERVRRACHQARGGIKAASGKSGH